MRRRSAAIGFIVVGMLMSACGTQPLPLPTNPVGTQPSVSASETATTVAAAPSPGVATLSGDIELSQTGFLDVYFKEPLVILQDMTGFVKRDYLYEQPQNAQTLGEVTVSKDGKLSYVLNLPERPTDPLNVVDHSGQSNPGVEIWQVMFDGNLIGGPFVSKDEFSGLGWGVNYTSAKVNVEDKYEVNGGKLIVWAPDDKEQFPTGFGPDGYLFTNDDPVQPIPQGYTVVDLDTNPFTFSRNTVETVKVYEGDLGIHDLSHESYSQAFEDLYQRASVAYPFTQMKQIDWQKLHDEFAPRFKDAEEKKDPKAYYEALRDFALSFPDGHVGIAGGDDFGDLRNRTAGSYGFAMTKLDDGSVIASYLTQNGPASKAGIRWGAKILKWNDQSPDDAAAAVVPPLTFSTDLMRQLQQYRYLVMAPVDTQISVTFQNPGGGQQTVKLKAAADGGEIRRRTSFFYGADPLALPLEFSILPSGIGYVKINSYEDDLNLLIRVWERAIQTFKANQIPAMIIDLRQNLGGQPLGSLLAGYFAKQRQDLYRTYYFSSKMGKFESFLPPQFWEPRTDLQYDGKVAILVGPGCASACEDSAWVLTQLPDVHAVGLYPTFGIFGEVGRGQYRLPEGWSFQIPTGYSADMQGNVIIEGKGVAPDVKVPITTDTLKAIYVNGQDVVLDTAVQTLSKQVQP